MCNHAALQMAARIRELRRGLRLMPGSQDGAGCLMFAVGTGDVSGSTYATHAVPASQ